MSKRLLIAKTGDTMPSVRDAVGDYDAMFCAHLDGVEAIVVQAHRTPDALPDPSSIDGLIITGSPHSVTQREPWAEALAVWARRVVDAEVPTLGVCYGHQLLAYALGGSVVKNPKQYTLGTVTVQLTDAGRQDELLGALDAGAGALEFQAVHGDVVDQIPAGAVRLATADFDVNQAFAIGDHVRTVQFHPEFTKPVMALYLEGRRGLIEADATRRGIDPAQRVDEIRDGLRDTPAGPALLRRFVTNMVLGGAR